MAGVNVKKLVKIGGVTGVVLWLMVALTSNVVASNKSGLVTIRGNIEAIDYQSGEVTINGVTVAVADTSIVQNKAGDSASLREFKVGYVVGCRFWKDKGGNTIERLLLFSKYSSYQIPKR